LGLFRERYHALEGLSEKKLIAGVDEKVSHSQPTTVNRLADY